MECPKCGGGSFLSDEEFVKTLENVQPMKVVIRSIFSCRACSERFSRIHCDDLESRRKPPEQRLVYQQSQYPEQPQAQQTQTRSSAYSSDEDAAAEGLKFF